MSTRPAGTWADTRLVAEREVGEKLRSRTFVLSTLFFLLFVGGSVALPALLSDDGPSQYDVAVVGADAEQLVSSLPPEQLEVDVRAVERDEAARLVEQEAVDAAVEVTDDGPVVTGLRSVPGELADALSGVLQQQALTGTLADAGVPAQEAERLLDPPPVQEVLLDDRGLGPAVVPLLTVAFGLLFFFVVVQFGYAIAQGVVQEKESRIVEILVSAVSIRSLLYGKVLGIGLLAVGQIALLLAVGLGGAALTGERELLGLLARNSPWFLVFFALGFALLSCLWAAAGAFASRSEDLQSTTTPLMALLFTPLFAALYVPDGPARTVLSFVPPSAPLMMPARLLEGDAAPWEAVVSALLLLAACVLTVRLGERLYRASLLRTRGRTTVRQAWSDQDAGSASR